MAISSSAEVGTFLSTASRNGSSTTSNSLTGSRPEKPVWLHWSQPVPQRNCASASSPSGTTFNWLGGGSYGWLQWGQFERTNLNPITPRMLEANIKGSISILINRVKAPAETPE